MAEVCRPLRKVQQVHLAVCLCVSEGYLEKGALRALRLLVAIREDSLIHVVYFCTESEIVTFVLLNLDYFSQER